MSGTDPGDDPSLPLSQIERVVATCDRFEAAWRTGQRPQVEDYLGDLPDPDRPALLRELLLLERELRRARGEQPTAAEYRARFPGDAALIDAAFASDLGPQSSDIGDTPPLPPRAADHGATSPPGTPSAVDPNGYLLGGRYQLLGEVAKGGMGAVLHGHDTALGRDLAVKVLLEEHKGDPELARRFLEEARITGQLQHPGVPPVHDLGTPARRPPLLRHEAGQGSDPRRIPQAACRPGRGPAPVHRYLRAGLPDGGLCAFSGRDPP